MKRISVAYWPVLVIAGFGCASVPAAPRDATSAHFEETAAHLHLGGTMYTYVDIEGDLAKGAALLDDLVRSTELVPDDVRTKLDTEKWVRMLGLDRVDAVGLSSYAEGEMFANRAFIHHTGERVGALRVGGDAPRPFEVLDLAPADSAMVFETDLNLLALKEVFLAIIEDAGGEEAAADVLSKLDEPAGPTGVAFGQLIDALDTKIMGVVRIDEERIQIPDMDLTVPVIDLVLVIDDFGLLFDAVVGLVAELPFFFYDAQPDHESLEVQGPLPGALARYRPIIRKDKETGRLYLASRRSYLDICLAHQTSIRESEDFVRATEGLPMAAGNSVGYTSPRFAATLQEISQGLLALDDDTRWMVPVIGELFPEVETGQSSVRVNHRNGTLFASNAAYSHKTTLLVGMMINPVTIGLLGALAVPAFKQYKDRAAGQATE